MMKVGHIGLGAVGGKLAGTLLRNKVDLSVHDLDSAAVAGFVARGARAGGNPAAMMAACDIVVTCLPSPAACAAVGEAMLPAMGPGKVWMEMSTTDADEVVRWGARVAATGGAFAECPVSGGVHRAATGNISIFMGGERSTFDRVFPLLQIMGRRILHTGELGTASTLKVMTNYLATANLLTCIEAMVTMKAAGMDLATTYEAIKISSGTSFVHETESQVILNGSRNIDFTMGLVKKDIGLFDRTARDHGVPLDISPLMVRLFDEAIERLGADAQSDRIIERLEAATGLSITAPGFPAEMVDDEAEEPGYEVRPPR
jgi:3-hydroxyisobutyrate dehydrogenase